MYRVSPERLHIMDYCNEIAGFINYALFNSKKYINGGGICPYKRGKNKKKIDPDIVMMHLLQKRFIEK
jgi:hypothetical protein